jgi:hypothetical protein
MRLLAFLMYDDTRHAQLWSRALLGEPPPPPHHCRRPPAAPVASLRCLTFAAPPSLPHLCCHA